MATLQKVLAAALRARALSARAAPRPRTAAGPFIGGCLMRLVLLVLILCAALVGALYLGGQALLQGWSPL